MTNMHSCVQDMCQAPARLVLGESAVQPVTLPAARAGQAGAIASAWLNLANQGNTSLSVTLQPQPASANVLLPSLWLDPGSAYSHTFAAEDASCSAVSGSTPSQPLPMALLRLAWCGSCSTRGDRNFPWRALNATGFKPCLPAGPAVLLI
jgi:hypothetical protein